MANMFKFWGKAINGLIDGFHATGRIAGAFDGAAQAMKTAWSAGKDIVQIQKGLRKAAKQLGSDNPYVREVVDQLIKENAGLGKAAEEYIFKSGKIKGAGLYRTKKIDEVLSRHAKEAGYMNAFQRAGAVGIGYAGFQKLRDPDYDVPLIPFI